MNLVVTGSIGIDTVELPTGEKREGVLGGSAVYFAAAASLYGKVGLVAAVGDDFPDELRNTIAGFEQIDAAGLETRAGSPTFRWGGKYLDDMDRRETTFTELGVLGEAPPPVPEAFKPARFVFLANGHPAVQGALLDSMTGPALTVADTMDLWIDTAKDDLTRLLGRVHGLVLNYDEAEHFTNRKNPVTAGKHLLDLGPRFVVVKKGEHGAILVHKDGIAAVPAYPTERVVDPTGAGDSFAGGMMGYLAQSADADPGSFDSVRRALAHGTVTASFNIESFSLERLAEINRQDLDKRFHEYAHMLRIE